MNPKGKLYVGKTYNLRKRINSHKCCTRKGSTVILHNSIRKYGWDNHLLSVIEEVPDEFINEREIFWIATLKTYCYENKMGLNMTIGGDGQRSTWMHDIERRKKASEYFTKNPPFKGRRHTEESKAIAGAKISKINKDKGQTVPKWGAEKGNEICRKPILSYNISGNLLGEFISLNAAAKHYNIDRKGITAVLCKEQTQYKGFIFAYKTDSIIPLVIDVSHVKDKNEIKPILRLNNNGNIIKEYANAKKAALELYIPQTNIQRAAKNYNGRPIRTGHIFVYKDEYELNQVTNN